MIMYLTIYTAMKIIKINGKKPTTLFIYQSHSALLFLKLSDLLVIIAADKQPWMSKNF